MLEIFIAVVAGIIVGAIILKYWREALVVLVAIITIILSILLLPVSIARAFCSEDGLTNKLLTKYDKLFYYSDNMNWIKKARMDILKMERACMERKKQKDEKEVLKFLEAVKWVI